MVSDGEPLRYAPSVCPRINKQFLFAKSTSASDPVKLNWPCVARVMS